MKSTHQRVIYTFIKRMARRLRGATLLERVLVVLTVWLTALPPVDAGFRSQVAEVAVLGTPAA